MSRPRLARLRALEGCMDGSNHISKFFCGRIIRARMRADDLRRKAQ